jgi:hypothetical protein
MKFRGGFVSNSSSSSFCIYGLYLEEAEYSKISDGYDLNEDVDKKLQDAGLSSVHLVTGQGDGYAYIGRDYSDIGDDETGRQFKDSVEKAVALLFPGQEKKCGMHEESWYDG